MLIGVVLLAFAAPAQANPLAHPGRAVTSGPLPTGGALQRLQAYPRTLVELDRVRGPAAAVTLRRAGGELIAPPLALWRLPSWSAQRVLPQLQRRGLVRSVTPDVPVGTRPGSASGFLSQFTDPLSTSEWWVSHVGADRWTAPGPGSAADDDRLRGRPLARGVRLAAEHLPAQHDDLLRSTSRSCTAPPPPRWPPHPRTASGSSASTRRPSSSSGTRARTAELTVGDEINGLFAARRNGPGVVNLSLGGFDRIPIEEHAIMNVFASGSLVVASAGNDREGGSSLSYPATFPHVLTVGATDENDRVTVFSSSSPALDLAAPGQDIPAAIPTIFNSTGYAAVDGTSFSAPLVSGAAAAVWTLRPTLTNTQLFQVMRRSARDVGKRGWDADTGYGILDLPAAVARRAPAADMQEPNEDVYLVKPNGLTKSGHAPLTGQHRLSASLSAQLEQHEDPEDVYRVWLPARGRLVVTVKPTANATLEIWGRRTTTVFERGKAAKRDLIGSSAHAGRRFERVTVQGRGVGQFVYVDVFLARKVVQASYTLSVAPSKR